MSADIKLFFNRFAEDFSMLNGDLIADRYDSPYTSVSSDGQFAVYGTSEEVAGYFKRVIGFYMGQDISKCKFNDLKYFAFNKNTFLATLTWHMLNSAGETVRSWRESYVLVSSKDTLKIITSIDHH